MPFLVVASGLILLSVAACHSGNGGNQTWKGFRPEQARKYQGTYTGSYDKGIITLVINYISGRTVSGYDVHKGLRRNVNGELTQQGALLSFVLKEPGGHPYDGIFTFTMDTTNRTIKGQWTQLDSNATKKIQPKSFDLTRSPEKDGYDQDMEWVSGGDSLLIFNPDGTCQFSFYKNPADSTSQQITVHGNYIHQVDTFRIEWEKNTHTPAQNMKMIIIEIHNQDAGGDYSERRLRGGGWEFYKQNWG
jgi:hypothetical protein